METVELPEEILKDIKKEIEDHNTIEFIDAKNEHQCIHYKDITVVELKSDEDDIYLIIETGEHFYISHATYTSKWAVYQAYKIWQYKGFV